MEILVTFFTEKLAGLLSKEAIVFIISMMPILELRGGLLASSLLGVPYLRAVVLCVIANIIPIPFVLLFIQKLVEILEHFNLTKGIALWFRGKVDKHGDSIEKYGFWGLTLFVGIPLPGTGAWTGAVVAGLLGMPLRRSVPSILLGLLLATIIMSIISYVLLQGIIA